MACSGWSQKLDAYLDGELTSPEAAALSAHMRTCAACATDAIERVHLKRSVQQAGKRYAPSAAFRSKILQQSTVASKPVRQNALWWRLAATAALVLVIAAGFLYSDHTREAAQRQRIYSEVADLHVANLASANPVEVVSTDRHTVKPWFQGKIPFSFNLPELQGTDFTLLGGRVTYLAQTPGAHLVYEAGKHKISVLIFPEQGMGETKLKDSTENELSFTVESWTQNNLRYFIISDTSKEHVDALKSLLQSAK